MEHTNLVQAYEFIRESGMLDTESALKWIARINQMYDRGWLYGSFVGDKLLAVAGAYRIPEWNEDYLHQLPEKEDGNVLFISFFVADSRHPVEPLKLLRQFLTRNPDIERIIYYKKYWKSGGGHFGVLKRSLIVGNMPGKVQNRLNYRNRVGVMPPDLLPINQFPAVSA